MGCLGRVCLAFALFCSLGSASKLSDYASSRSGEALVDYVNSQQDLWKAELSPAAHKASFGFVKSAERSGRLEAIAESRKLNIELPKQFDARKKWPMCKTIGHIRDQSRCGSCWAVATAEIMTDRLCIASNGSIQVSLSAADLMSCSIKRDGCQGGDPLEALEYWYSAGVVTGSDYPGHKGCEPYPFTPCGLSTTNHTYPTCESLPDFKAPECKKRCQRSYKRAYNKDKYYGQKPYTIESNVKAIQKELYTNGPITVGFMAYDDLSVYRKGIYKHIGGDDAQGHAVKLIGWGEEKDKPYWLVANSWGEQWGEKGFFRIVRGTDECEFESKELVAALADLKRSPKFA